MQVRVLPSLVDLEVILDDGSSIIVPVFRTDYDDYQNYVEDIEYSQFIEKYECLK